MPAVVTSPRGGSPDSAQLSALSHATGPHGGVFDSGGERGRPPVAGERSPKEDMFWILRRAKLASAAALLNNLNNNNEPRPARKAYNKLCGSDDQTKVTNNLNDDQACKKEGCVTNGNTGNETDTDSSFTDIEIDDGNDFSDSDYDEALTCNVCDRSFSCSKQLSSHKQKKRHFGCSACDSLFTTLMALEHHKEEFEHWSGDEDDFCTDSEDEDDTVISEECERLL